jgi:hypothetical protein
MVKDGGGLRGWHSPAVPHLSRPHSSPLTVFHHFLPPPVYYGSRRMYVAEAHARRRGTCGRVGTRVDCPTCGRVAMPLRSSIGG